MGEYLTKYNQVRDLVKDFQLAKACAELKELLNLIYRDMTNSKNNIEISKAKKAIEKLKPAYEDLKNGNVTDRLQEILDIHVESFQDMFDEVCDMVNSDDSLEANNQIVEDVPQVETPEIVTQIPEEHYDEVETSFEEVSSRTSDIKKYDRKPLTPKTLDDYIGQDNAKRNIRVAINAAKIENRVLEHMLICSPYGLGKTTLANIIANEMDLPFFSVNSTSLKDAKSLNMYFSKIKESCIIFIDEIHSLKDDVQTILLSILSDYRVSYIDGTGNEKVFDLPPFTLIGATTQAGELLKPFLNRFAIIELVDYTDLEKKIITKSKFDKLNYEVSDDAIDTVALRSRGIPRTIETFVKGIRDVAISHESKKIDIDIVNEYFEMIGIDEYGLGKNDHAILNALKNSDRPLALITIESKTGIQKEDLEYRYEPYLIKLGFIEKTERGRIITESGIKYLENNQI